MILTKSLHSAFSHAYRGDYETAIELLGTRWRGVGLEPVRQGEGDAEYAELLLVCGFLTTELGRFNGLRTQAEAKDMLSKAERLFGDDPRAQEARLWLALSYLWCGENNETLSLTDSILAQQTAESCVTFIAGHVRGLVLVYLGKLSEAEASFASVEVLLDTVLPMCRGKFYLNRGILHRRLGQLADALQDYDQAYTCFKEAGSVRYQAAARNNAARVYAEIGDYEKAHAAARSALSRFIQLNDRLHEAKVWDEIARIHERQGAYVEMEECASQAVSILSIADHEGWLAEALITLGTAKAHLGMLQAQDALLRALAICERQDDPEQARVTTNVMWETVKRGRRLNDVLRDEVSPLERTVYERVLAEHNGRISPAAHSLGYTHHQTFMRRLQEHFPELLCKRRPVWKRHHSLMRK